MAELKDFMPRSDSEIQSYTATFASLLDTNFEAWAVTRATATEYVAQQQDFTTRLEAATNPETRGQRTVFLKDESRAILVANTRKIAKQLNGLLVMTNSMRQLLGLPIPSGHRTPIGPPTAIPVVVAGGVLNRTVPVDVRQSAAKRGKPAKVTLVSIFYCFSENEPTPEDKFELLMTTSETKLTLTFPPSAVSDKVWVSAQWMNAKGETGPASRPISINLPAGGSQVSAEEPTIKIAKAA
jgi:hypothetical protein